MEHFQINSALLTDPEMLLILLYPDIAHITSMTTTENRIYKNTSVAMSTLIIILPYNTVNTNNYWELPGSILLPSMADIARLVSISSDSKTSVPASKSASV